MVRTVRVRLELDRDDYRSGLRDAASDMRGFDAEVRALGNDAARTGVEVKSAGTEVQSMGTKVDAAAKQTRALGDEAEKTRRKTTGLGDDTKTTTSRFVDLGREIDDTKIKLRQLIDLYTITGDTDVLRQYRSTKGQLGILTQMKAEFDEARKLAASSGDDVRQSFWSRVLMLGGSSISNSLIPSMTEAGTKGATVFASGFRGALATFAGPIGIAFGVPLITSIGAILGGATLATAGLGGIAAAIIAQLQNERVRAAATQLGADLRSRIMVATSGLAEPIAAGFKAMLREMSPFFVDLRKGFDSLAPYLTNLMVKVGEGLSKLGPGLAHAMQAAGPVIGVIGNGISMLMGAVGSFFDQVSKGGKGAAQAMDMIFRAVSALISGAGVAIRVFSQLFSVFADFGTALTGFLAKIPGIGEMWKPAHEFMVGVRDSFKKGTLSAGGFSNALGEVRLSADGASGSLSGAAAQAWSVKGAFDAASGGSIGLLQANLSGHQALDSFTEAVKASSGSLDINTQKGQAAMQAALGLRDAAIEVGQRVFEQTHSSEAAARAIDDYRGAMVTAMVQSGMTRQAAQALTDQLLGIPPSVKTDVSTPGMPKAQADVREHTRGIEKVPPAANTTVNAHTETAMARIGGLENRLNAVDGKTANTYVTNTITTRYTTIGTPVAPRGAATATFAEGGIHSYGITPAASGLLRPSSPGTILAAEPQTGGEALIPRLGISDARGLALANVAAGWHGGTVIPARAATGGGVTYVNLTLNAGLGVNGAQLGRQVADVLKPYILSAGGGNVQSALGKRGA